jgi:hypothetical protein
LEDTNSFINVNIIFNKIQKNIVFTCNPTEPKFEKDLNIESQLECHSSSEARSMASSRLQRFVDSEPIYNRLAALPRGNSRIPPKGGQKRKIEA